MKEVLQMCRNSRKVSPQLQKEHRVSLRDRHRKNILSEPTSPVPPTTSLEIAYERSPLKPQHHSTLKKATSTLVGEGSPEKPQKITKKDQGNSKVVPRT